jgi:hypothetical protein
VCSSAQPNPVVRAKIDPASHKIYRQIVVVKDAPAPGVPVRGLERGAQVAITTDRHGLYMEVAAGLEAAGYRVEALIPGEPLKAHVRNVVYLGGLEECRDLDEASRLAQRAFELAVQLAPRMEERGGVFITVQDTGGTFGLDGFLPAAAPLGAIAGLIKTAAQEWPLATVRAIDLDASVLDREALVKRLVDELTQGGDALLEVGLMADGRRVTLETQAVAARPVDVALGATDVVLASGGGRGVTATCLIALAQASRASFVLLGRTPLEEEPEATRHAADDAAIKRALLDAAKNAGQVLSLREAGAQAARIIAVREVRATLAAIEAAGGRARYAPVDVQDVGGLFDLLRDVRAQWGPITALVHGAGVLADKRLAEKSVEQFERVYQTKVAGLIALLAVTAGDPLRVLCAFSSTSARVGNLGQSDYAMANEALNKIAQVEARRRPGCVVKAINWGPWDGGMVTPGLRAQFEARGVAILPEPLGAQMFVDEIGQPDGQVEIVISGLLSKDAAPDRAMRVESLRLRHVLTLEDAPYLTDHRVKGRAIAPLVLIVDWMADAMRRATGHVLGLTLRDVQVLRGVAVEPHAELEIEACDVGQEGWTLTVRDEERKPRYRANALVSAREDVGMPAGLAGIPSGQARLHKHPYLSPALFHGEALQVLGEARRDEAGVWRADVDTLSQRQWIAPHGRWQTDMAAMDAGLQLVLWWAWEEAGLSVLPMGIDRVRLASEGLCEGLWQRVVLVPGELRADGARADVYLLDAQGHCVAALEGVRCVAMGG